MAGKGLTTDARRMVLAGAAEALRRGDARIGTDHLLLGLLTRPGSLTERVLGVDLAAAQSALQALDREALAAVGIDIGDLGPAEPIRSRRRPPLTSGARVALKRSVDTARADGARRIVERHLLPGLLACRRPDPSAELLAELGVDPMAARERLAAGAS